MGISRYLKLIAGVWTEKAATDSSTGITNAGDIVALDVNGLLAENMMPVGIGAEIASILTTEDLAAGDWVNIYNSSGAKCRKADATVVGKEARGFVLASSTSAQSAVVYFPGKTNNGLTGLTPGAIYFLSTTAGQGVATTPPSGAGNIVQELGVADSATQLVFFPSKPVTLA